MHKKYLILIVGPTAVGKTDLCVSLARQFKTEIISCDSRQFYKELNIGTAKPAASEMKGIPHHFVDSHHISDYYSAGDFERDSQRLLKELFKKHDAVIMTGGSGLFIKAITHGLDDMPEAPVEIREELMKRLRKEGLGPLQQLLLQLDPEYYELVDIQNSQRVVRALEVCLGTGKTFTSFQLNKTVERDYEIIKIGLERPREELYARINQRMDEMLEAGLVEEARTLIEFRYHNALRTVGYKEIFAYFDGEYGYEEMVELLKRNSRRYAKKQLTWFRNQDVFEWFDPGKEEAIIAYLQQKMK
jgi:tRNA dimethylallyltransferase